MSAFACLCFPFIASDARPCSMFQVLQGIRAPPFQSDNGLPKEMVVLAHDCSAQMPTHLFAVFSKPSTPPSPSNRTAMMLYPAHHVVFAAHCSNFPRLKLSAPPPPQQRGGPVVLPVVPIVLPHPASYHAMHQYFYLKDPLRFMSSLLPSAPPPGVHEQSEPVTEQYVKHLATTFTSARLLSAIRHVHGACGNMVKLGVDDAMMWQLLNIAWEVLLSAMAVHVNSAHLSPLPIH